MGFRAQETSCGALTLGSEFLKAVRQMSRQFPSGPPPGMHQVPRHAPKPFPRVALELDALRQLAVEGQQERAVHDIIRLRRAACQTKSTPNIRMRVDQRRIRPRSP